MATQRARSTGRPTLDEVAALAGVGRGTVSRVVNGSTQVSAEARVAVREAIATLGYVPNRAARALVTRRTDVVALVVDEAPERTFGEPFLADVIRGVSSALAETPLQLWLAMARTPTERESIADHLTGQHVDGALLLSTCRENPLPGLLRRRALPTVIGGRPPQTDPDGWFVDVDNVGGARAAVEYLLRSGRRRVATIAGPQDVGAGIDRLAGYRQALGKPSARMIAYGDFSASSGAAAMSELLVRQPSLDAVVVACDLMAAGALRTLRAAGRRVPDDVAVVGFDDSSFAEQTDPPLTSVSLPVGEMGRRLATMLIGRLEAAAPPTGVLLETRLIRRASA